MVRCGTFNLAITPTHQGHAGHTPRPSRRGGLDYFTSERCTIYRLRTRGILVPLDCCKTSTEDNSLVDLGTLGRCKKSAAPTRPELSCDEVQETIAIVDRWYDSIYDWKPWSPPSSEDEVRHRAGPDAMRPEIATNEEKHRQLIQIATSVHSRASALSLVETPLTRARWRRLQFLCSTAVV